jgi:hypothetical protein
MIRIIVAALLMSTSIAVAQSSTTGDAKPVCSNNMVAVAIDDGHQWPRIECRTTGVQKVDNGYGYGIGQGVCITHPNWRGCAERKD